MTESSPEKLLAELTEKYGQDMIDKVAGTWLGKSHKERPRLLWAKPDKPARAPHYLAFVRQLPCCICGTAAESSDPHHVGKHAMGVKTDDYRCIPLCRKCHMQVHDGKAIKDLNSRVIKTLILYLRIVEQT